MSKEKKKKVKKEHKNREHKVKKEDRQKEKSEQSKQKSKSKSKSKSVQPIEKEKPNFDPSGILAKFASNAISEDKVLKFTEPLDAKIPVQNWKLFPFKGDEALNPISLKGRSSFLIGRDKQVAQIHLENLSVSSQHAVIQFRQIHKIDQSGSVVTIIKPYIMDLESTNGTTLNGDKLESARYFELIDKDVLKFGFSGREFVLIKD
ncbi:hypothetical protein pb186bvf_019840 [Paramecium bursaria]